MATEKKTPKHDTWMPLYVSEYLADTMHLTVEQHGAYMLLLMAAWKNDGRLLGDPVALQQIARMTPQQWAKSEPTLARFFDAVDGCWIQKRVVQELEKAKENVAKKSKAGYASAAARWGLAPQKH
jgi:uncharacterized protein YdaU (DUF1376 family)